MTVTILRCILLCLLVTSVVQAETPVPTTPWRPPTTVLPPEELAPLLEAWDQAMASNKFDDKDRMCVAVGGFIPKGMRFAEGYILRYSNPEIIDRVINHYLEVAANKAAGQHWVAPDASSEGSAEYMMFLASMAESTFDPRVYEAVLTHLGGFAGNFRNFYLATVNPERTLDLLFESKLGPYPGKRGSQNCFYHHEIDMSMHLSDAYRILLLMFEQSPEALRTKRLQVISFVTAYAKHFATPQKRSYEPKPVYLEWSDYWTRSRALDVVGFLGASSEVKRVEAIIHDAREVDLEYLRSTKKLDRYEQIREKGLRVIKQISRRSPSER
jgi:hypothetical protein